MRAPRLLPRVAVGGLAAVLLLLGGVAPRARAGDDREAARAVVSAVAKALAENAGAEGDARLFGDALGDLCVRRAAAAAPDARAFAVGLAVATDPDGTIVRHPVTASVFRGLESDEEAVARRATLGHPTLVGRNDLLLHFATAAGLAAARGRATAETIAYAKEARDAVSGSGFSFADYAADLAGIEVVERLRARTDLRAALDALAASWRGADALPDLATLEEGVTATAFRERFGGPTDARFTARRDDLLRAVRARPAIAALAPLAPAAARDVSDLLRGPRAAHDVPGMACVVLEGEAVAATGADGLRRRGGRERVTPTDRFHLGSCTKAMTATLYAMAVERGALAFDARVAASFPDVSKIDAGWKGATVEMLLAHRGGAPTDLSPGGLWARLFTMGGPGPAQRTALLEGVLRSPPAYPPGTKAQYANAGFAIAGALLERREKKAWEDLMRERLFVPLGMTTAGFGAPGVAGEDDEPRGHRPEGTTVEPGPGSDNPAAIGPAGTVHASLPDWAKFVALHLRGEDEKTARLLRAETYRRLHAQFAPDAPYALGWIVAERPWGGGRVLMHAGSNTMWYVVAWLAPKRDFAVLVGANRGGLDAEKACDEAAWALIQDRERRAASSGR